MQFAGEAIAFFEHGQFLRLRVQPRVLHRDRDLIGQKSRLRVIARIEAGRKLLFAGNRVYPVGPSEAPFELLLKPANRPVR